MMECSVYSGRSNIDGIGSEDAFFPGDQDEDNEYSPRPEVLSILDRFRNEGKVVMSVEYLKSAEKIRQFQEKACERGFIPQVAHRALDSLEAEVLLGCH